MYKIVPWSETLDLEEFYIQAGRRGFDNNSSQEKMIDCFKKEKLWAVWILYYNEQAVGSVAAHSFPELGDNCYRIAARTCVLSDLLPYNTLRTVNQIVTHQHITSQFLIPICLEWLPNGGRSFITTNENSVGTQRLVHRIFAPAMQKTGQMKRVCEMFYRGTEQTVWELYPDRFYDQLNRYPRWK